MKSAFAMDLSINHDIMGIQNHHESHEKDTYDETDLSGNNNFFNSFKTETNNGHENDSLFQVKDAKDRNLIEINESLFRYSSFKNAMDLRTHNRTVDGKKRTIFDDAEYFAQNYSYKLLPITFEQVDETAIKSEHNYSLCLFYSESEPEDEFSRTLDYSQIKEKNYKRRRTKTQEREEQDDKINCENVGYEESTMKPQFETSQLNQSLASEQSEGYLFENPETENSLGLQPLDLSASPAVQERKTEPYLRERSNSIEQNKDTCQLDSDKENSDSKLNGILVTITRPDEKENYQPCDLFLNDIARLVPWLIDKDCFEVDILDKTCDRVEECRNPRLYYVISESTWRYFQKTKERVILTTDKSLGLPIVKSEKNTKPSYLVFDQYSLTKSLADHCKEIGGCFQYSCVEDRNEDCEEEKIEDTSETDSLESKAFVEEKQLQELKNSSSENESCNIYKKESKKQKVFERKKKERTNEVNIEKGEFNKNEIYDKKKKMEKTENNGKEKIGEIQDGCLKEKKRKSVVEETKKFCKKEQKVNNCKEEKNVKAIDHCQKDEKKKNNVEENVIKRERVCDKEKNQQKTANSVSEVITERVLRKRSNSVKEKEEGSERDCIKNKKINSSKEDCEKRVEPKKSISKTNIPDNKSNNKTLVEPETKVSGTAREKRNAKKLEVPSKCIKKTVNQSAITLRSSSTENTKETKKEPPVAKNQTSDLKVEAIDDQKISKEKDETKKDVVKEILINQRQILHPLRELEIKLTRITTKSNLISESETSHTSENSIKRSKRSNCTVKVSKEEPPSKKEKSSEPVEVYKNTRSAKNSLEVKPENKKVAKETKTSVKGKVVGKTNEVGRSMRSRNQAKLKSAKLTLRSLRLPDTPNSYISSS